MILLDGKEYEFGSKEAPAGAGETFKLEITGEVFTSKEELDAHTAKYEEQVWTSSYDPKYVRTLEDALKYDERCRALAASFPESHKDAVLRLFHHCTAVSLDKLADIVYEKTRPAEPPSPVKAAAPPPEENGAAAAASPAPAGTPGAPAPAPGPIIPAETLRGVPARSAAPKDLKEGKPKAEGPKGPKHPLNRTQIRALAVETAEQRPVPGIEGRSLWYLIRPEDVQRLGLPADPPESLVESLKRPPKPARPAKAEKAEKGEAAGKGDKPEKMEKKKKKAEGEGAEPKEKGGGEEGEKKKKKKREEDGDGKADGGATPKKAKKDKAPEGDAADGPPRTPGVAKKKKAKAEGGEGGSGPGDAKPKEGEAKPKEKKVKEPYTRTVAEEEALVMKKPDSFKALLFRLLKEAGPSGRAATWLLEEIISKKLRDLSNLKSPIESIKSILTHEDAFCRIGQGIYALQGFPGVVALPPPQPKAKRAPGEGGEGDQPPKKKKKKAEGAEGAEGGEGGPKEKKEKKAKEEGGEAAAAKPKPKLKKDISTMYEDKEGDKLQGEAEAKRLRDKLAAIRAHLARCQAAAKDNAPVEGAPELTATAIHERAVAECPKFELPADLRDFKTEDRKLMLEWRQKVQEEERKTKKLREDWIAQRKTALTDEKANKLKALRKSLDDVKVLEKLLAHFERDLARVDKELDKERRKEEAVAAKAQRDREREEEKERKRLEAIAAKKYPMDDLELLEELKAAAQAAREAAGGAAAAAAAAPAVEEVREDVPLPPPMPSDQQAMLVPLLIVTDFISAFREDLGLQRAPNLQQLSEALDDDTLGWGLNFEPTDRPNPKVLDDLPYRRLTRVYEILLENLLEGAEDRARAEEYGRLERRWLHLLTVEGAWPEIAARYVLTEDPDYIPEAVAAAARELRAGPAERMTLPQHATLLCYLCDLMMDQQPVREGVEVRLDELEELERTRNEEKRKIKEERRAILDEEREEKEKKREEERKKKEEEDAAAAAAAGAADGEAAEEAKAAADGKDGKGGKDKPKPKPKKKKEDEAAAAPAEPTWELPEDLREYKGDLGDRKAHSDFRQRQQAEKRRLDKEKDKFFADLVRKQREEDKAKKALELVHRARERKKEELKEREQALQEKYEAERRKIAIRAALLGTDRYHRRYYWGLGGRRDRVFYEQPPGVGLERQPSTWGEITSVDDLVALYESLDSRGVRERELKESLEDSWKSIERAMKMSETDRARAGDAGPINALGIRASGRERKSAAVIYDPNKASQPSTTRGRKGRATVKASGNAADISERVERNCSREVPAGLFRGQSSALEEIAFTHGLLAVLRVTNKATRVGMHVPEGFLERLETLSKGQVPAASPHKGLEGMKDALGRLLRELELSLLSLTNQTPEGLEEKERAENSKEEEEEDGDEDEDRYCPWLHAGIHEFLEEDSGRKKGEELRKSLWRSNQERRCWLYDFEKAATFARLCYAAGALEYSAGPMLRSREREGIREGRIKLDDGEVLSDDSDSEAGSDSDSDSSDSGLLAELEQMEGGRKTRGQRKEEKAKKKAEKGKGRERSKSEVGDEPSKKKKKK